MNHNLTRIFICVCATLLMLRMRVHFGLPLAVLAAGAFWAALFPHVLIGLIPFIKRSADASALLKWHGCYYEFKGVQVRFFLSGATVWVAADDIRRLISPPLQQRELFLLAENYSFIPGHSIKGLSETGLLRLLEMRTSHRRADPGMIKFKLWLETEAYPNVKRLPGSAIPPAG